MLWAKHQGCHNSACQPALYSVQQQQADVFCRHKSPGAGTLESEQVGRRHTAHLDVAAADQLVFPRRPEAPAMHADGSAAANAKEGAALCGDWRGFESDAWRALRPRPPQPLAFLRQQVKSKQGRQHASVSESTDGGTYTPRYGTSLHVAQAPMRLPWPHIGQNNVGYSSAPQD